MTGKKAANHTYIKARIYGITFSELRKISCVRIIVCMILVIVKICTSVSAFGIGISYEDEMKNIYIAEYRDLPLEETYEAVSERMAHYDEISAQEYVSAMAAKRVRGDISHEEYDAYRAELEKSRTYKDTLLVYQTELESLLEKADKSGIEAKPVMSTGFSILLARDFEVTAALMFIVLFSGLYSREYETGSIALLRTAKRGRERVFFTKAAETACISLIVSLAFSLLDIILTFKNYDMSFVGSPLFAIKGYTDTSSGITVGRYLTLITVLRAVGYMLLGLLISALSGALKSEWGAAGVTLLLFIPYLLRGLGIKMFEAVDITTMLSADRLYLLSTSWGGLAGLVLIILGWSAVTAAVYYRSYRSFCK